MENSQNIASFLSCISPLLSTQQVQSMGQWRHHFDVTCYDHCLFVSYVAFRLARRWGLDYQAAARAGLLHDFYLYDPTDKSAHPGSQCMDHPVIALRNASDLIALTQEEKNSILTHMWPLSPHMPKCKLALVVNLADKICSMLEVFHIYHAIHMRQKLPMSSAV